MIGCIETVACFTQQTSFDIVANPYHILTFFFFLNNFVFWVMVYKSKSSCTVGFGNYLNLKIVYSVNLNINWKFKIIYSHANALIQHNRLFLNMLYILRSHTEILLSYASFVLKLFHSVSEQNRSMCSGASPVIRIATCRPLDRFLSQCPSLHTFEVVRCIAQTPHIFIFWYGGILISTQWMFYI